jgi:penicillin-binding protein 2
VTTTRLRLGIVGVVAISLFATLFIRLAHLQFVHGTDARQAAARNTVRVVTLPAARGRILDRDGTVLVDNRASNVVAVDPAVDERERGPLLDRLALVLGVDRPVLEARLGDRRASPYLPVPVAEELPDDAVIRLREQADDLPGVVAQRVATRSYPFGSLAAHILGYVGDSPDDGRAVGRAGVEAIHDDDLRGVDGEVRMEVDADGRPLRVLERRPPVQGADVVLSIDADVQRVTEDALAEGLAAARARPDADDGSPLVADAGSAVALDPRSGAVLAMASYPTFPLPELANGVSPAEADLLFGTGSGAPFVNRALRGYAPGSTWKLVTATAALTSGLISPSTVVRDGGTFTIPGCATGCERQNAGAAAYGPVDVSRALAVSSDVFFYAQGAGFWQRRASLGETRLQDVAASLGFGRPTGTDLPDESGGRLPTPASRAALHAEDPAAWPEGRWFVGDDVNLAIGQGDLAVTPLQLANAYAAFGNGGTRYAPGLVLRVQRQDGTVVRTVDPEVAGEVELPEDVRRAVLDGLVGATTDPDGTATQAFAGWPSDRYPVAGKTGTAQAKPKQDSALFAAVAPLADPQVAVAVVMEQAGFGADAAAPVARRILGVASGVEPPPEAVAP